MAVWAFFADPFPLLFVRVVGFCALTPIDQIEAQTIMKVVKEILFISINALGGPANVNSTANQFCRTFVAEGLIIEGNASKRILPTLLLGGCNRKIDARVGAISAGVAEF